MRLIELDTTESTNDEARRLAQNADFGPVWIRANQQTYGRGRRGRDWVSPKGNLYCSALFATDLPIGRLGQYSFVAALAAYEALLKIHPIGDFGIKWPNDTLLGGAKISGLLLETGKTHHQSWIIVGIGVNLVSHPEDTPYPATSLAAHMDTDVDGALKPKVVLQILSGRFKVWKSKFEREGFEPIRKAWCEAAVNIPGPVTVKLPDEEFEGTAIDMGHNGALQVRLANGTIREVHAGDVYLG